MLNIFFQNQRDRLQGSRKTDYYAEIGEYIWNIFKGNLPEELKFFEDMFKEKIIKKLSVFNNREQQYSSIAIHFLTSVLNGEILKKLFGDPIYHNEFGEGFDGPYDEETDEYGEPEIKESYASYFVEIEGVKFHIGYDNRGTNIEVEPNLTAEQVVTSIKKLIDMTKNIL